MDIREGPTPMSAVRERLGILCDQVARHADVEQVIRAAGAGAELDRLLHVVRTAQPDQRADPNVMTELLDAIEQACARNGLLGVTTVTRYTALPTGFPRQPKDVPPTWICPLRSCARVVFDDETAAPPQCAAAGSTMLSVPTLP